MHGVHRSGRRDEEPARLSGVAPSQSAAEAETSPRAHSEPVRSSIKRAGDPGSTPAAAVSELPAGPSGEPARLSSGAAGDSHAAEGIAISEPPPRAGGEHAHLSGGRDGSSRPTQDAPISVPAGWAQDKPACLLSGVGKPELTNVSVAHPGDGLAGGTGDRGGSPGDGVPDRARPDRPAVDRLAEQGDAGGAVTRSRRPG